MPAEKHAKRPDSALALRLADTRSRLKLSPAQMADYLGVPIYTLRKWESGERQGSATLLRLLDILGMMEALAPALHDSLIVSNEKSVMSKNPVSTDQP